MGGCAHTCAHVCVYTCMCMPTRMRMYLYVWCLHIRTTRVRPEIYVRMHVHPCIYMYTFIHVHTCASMYIHVYIYTCTHMHACFHARMHTCTHARTHACMHARTPPCQRGEGEEEGAASRARHRAACRPQCCLTFRPHTVCVREARPGMTEARRKRHAQSAT